MFTFFPFCEAFSPALISEQQRYHRLEHLRIPDYSFNRGVHNGSHLGLSCLSLCAMCVFLSSMNCRRNYAMFATLFVTVCVCVCLGLFVGSSVLQSEYTGDVCTIAD